METLKLNHLKELDWQEHCHINGGSALGYTLGYMFGYLGKGLSMPGAVDIALDFMKK